jgi:hypothetical protein
MLRYLAIFLLPALMFLADPSPALAQWRQPAAFRDSIAGQYVNQSAGGQCSVYRRGGGYVFVNENGSKARFVYSGSNQLVWVAGDWDPNIVVTVLRSRDGRTMLRFDAPNTPTGYWVKTS